MRASSRSCALASLALLSGLLGGCADITRATLLRSELSATPPLGTVRLPARHDGISFQGSASLGLAATTTADLGAVEKSNTLLSSSLDSSFIGSGVQMRQDQVVFSGEASIFLSRFSRLCLGTSQGNAFWVGAGGAAGKEWMAEGDISIGRIDTRRREVWRLETTDLTSGSTSLGSKTVHDTLIVRRDTSMFWRLDLSFARRKGGPVIAYQYLRMPATTSPTDVEYTASIHTTTVGWFEPTRAGTVSAFASLTSLGKTWSPMARLQYTMDLGGK